MFLEKGKTKLAISATKLFRVSVFQSIITSAVLSPGRLLEMQKSQVPPQTNKIGLILRRSPVNHMQVKI